VLPGVDGFGILEQIRKNEKTKALPVIIFSNLAEDKDIQRAKELGANEFMIKSNFTLDELAEKIGQIVGK
jgi:CheY-like chemotaxis protein